MDSLQQRLAEAMEQLKETEAAVARAEEELQGSSYTVKSADRSVEVTVDAQGTLVGMRFLGDLYRDMTASELAASVLEAVERGRMVMARQVMTLLDPLTQALPAIPEMPGLTVDWAKIFGPGVLEEDPDDIDVRHSQRRLRDEISEDEEE
ncbi:YbaB/EbfC family nucleoid-associated protein [Streptomyces sp. PSKA30]|uniref:YbaB/EbfC family nucleoid-associated protein n=1 Tax=Streptomyces sp. PSKA30 TaxID=2874597 RepID=UPI001CD12494|nr:YbaB/EbfC family nucleoid-associated protein [Streptomyces sp. PSKA30]MBZ9641181.1 YbaB/EbfC family nucleoid-associated protein [Streptomyces sp. PSKA30]